MSEPFERTTRYLSADGGGLALAGAAFGLVIAALWLGWLFLARVPVYVQAQGARPEESGVYSVTVERGAATRLRPGQHASLQPAASTELGAAAPSLAATVAEVDPVTGLVRIELDRGEEQQAGGAGGTVWIVAEQVSPATLIGRALEQAFAAP